MSVRRRCIERSATERLGLERPRVDDVSLQAVAALFSDADAWLEQLPADQRAAVRAYVVEDERYEEIAVRLGIAPAAARKRVSRGLARLRQTLEHERT